MTSARGAEHRSTGGRLVLLDGDREPDIRRPAGSRSVRVLIAEGQALVRAGLKALLEDEGNIAVVGEAAGGEEAVALAHALRPDVVLIDLSLPGLDSVEATRQMLTQPGLAVMLMTGSESDERIFDALRAGASGLLLKDMDPAELARAVNVLSRGEALLSPLVTHRLIAELVSRPEPYTSSELLDGLTAREREVVALVGQGLSNDEIAGELVVSPATAKTHVSRSMIKLRARDRAKLVVLAYEAGLVLAA